MCSILNLKNYLKKLFLKYLLFFDVIFLKYPEYQSL